MKRISPHNFEPGTYVDSQGFEVVVLDIIDYSWNDDKQLMEYLSSPMVMGRDLMMGSDNRYIWPMEVFKSKFRKR